MVADKIRRFVRLVYILSTVFIPINATVFNVVYLYAYFSRHYETWWAFTPARLWCFIIVGNVVVSLIALLCDIFILQRDRFR